MATIGDDALLVDSEVAVSWLDADVVREADHSVTIAHPAGELVVTHLGAAFDRFCAELREARGLVRRACADAVDRPARSIPMCHTRVTRSSTCTSVPVVWSSSRVVEARPRCRCRRSSTSRVTVGRSRSTSVCSTRSCSAGSVRGPTSSSRIWTARESRSSGDGWAVSGQAVSGGRAEEVALLSELAGDRLRAGIWTDGGRTSMPFVLAPVGDLVAVEATDADDRATYIFRVDDVDRLNAVLVLTTFRREVYSLPDAELGKWATAVRVLEPVRWLRGALAGRVIHDDSWPDKIRAALGA